MLGVSVGPVLAGRPRASQPVAEGQAHTLRHTPAHRQAHTGARLPRSPLLPLSHTCVHTHTCIHTHTRPGCIPANNTTVGALAALGRVSLAETALAGTTGPLAAGELKIASLGPRRVHGRPAPCRQGPTQRGHLLQHEAELTSGAGLETSCLLRDPKLES